MALRYPRAQLKASDYQKPDDPVRAIAERRESAIGAKLAWALRRLGRAVPKQAIAEKITARDTTGAADLVNVTSFEHDMRIAFEPIASAYRDAAQLGARQVRGLRRVRKDTPTFSGDPEAPDDFAVDLYSEEVLSELRGYQDALITALTEDMRQDVFQTITSGLQANLAPEEIAAELQYQVGLNVPLAKAVRSYRLALENADANALTRALRDATSDAEVQNAINSGVALSKERIDELTLAYANRAVQYRAQNIAQTESTRAASMGLEAAYRQMIGSGLFPDAAVRKHWRIAMDERTCITCIMLAVASNAAGGVAIGAAFIADGEEITAPPAHVRCRCSLEIIVDLIMGTALAVDPGGNTIEAA